MVEVEDETIASLTPLHRKLANGNLPAVGRHEVHMAFAGEIRGSGRHEAPPQRGGDQRGVQSCACHPVPPGTLVFCRRLLSHSQIHAPVASRPIRT
jgi:hypothetical protein